MSQRGELHHSAKLTAEKVRSIRASTLGQDALAKLHGVIVSAIWLVRSRRSWKHVA